MLPWRIADLRSTSLYADKEVDGRADEEACKEKAFVSGRKRRSVADLIVQMNIMKR